MALLVMQVAASGELVEVFEMPVDDVDGHRMLACANEDERVIHRAGQILEDGEVWIDLIDRDGETLFDQVACFHRVDAADALQLHFNMNADVVKDCLSKSNVASLYARHRVAAQAYFRKIDRLVDCSMVARDKAIVGGWVTPVSWISLLSFADGWMVRKPRSRSARCRRTSRLRPGN